MDLRENPGRRELGKRVQSAIMEAGYESLPAFAERIGCSRALIYQYVKGDVLVQPDRLTTIAELTGKALAWFYADDPNEPSEREAGLRQQLRECRQEAQELARDLARERGARSEQAETHRRTLMEALRELCLAHRRAGDAASMLEIAPRWLELARDAGDERAEMDARLQTGHAWFQTGELARAERSLSDALMSAIVLKDGRSEGSIRQELVRVLQAAGRTEEACDQARRVAEGQGWWPRWSGLVSLAAMAEQTGELEEAEARLEEATEAIDQGEATPQQRALARTYVASNRANVSLARGRYTEALEHAKAHRGLAEAAHLPDQLREASLNAAIANVRTGDVNEAASELQRLDEWCTMSGDRRVGALVKVFVGELLRRSGDLPQAKRAGLNALESATECGHEVVLAEAELALAEAYAAEGQLDDAGHRFTKCIDRAARLAYRRHDVAGRLGLALVASRERDRDALRDIERVRSTAADLGYEDLEVDALLACAELLPPEDAAQASEQAAKLARAAGYFWGESAGLLTQGEAQLALGDLNKAVDSLKQAARLKLRRTHARQGARLYARERELRRALVEACRAAGESTLLGPMARLHL